MKTACTKLSILTLLMLLACSEVVDLKTETEDELITVYGRITNGTQGNTLNISRTRLLGELPFGVSGATVSVTDGSGNVFDYEEAGDGNYELRTGTPVGIPGERYTLRVELPDGKVITSLPEVMPAVASRDSMYFRIQPVEEGGAEGGVITRDVISIYADTRIFDPRPDLYMKWNVEEVYTFEQAVLPGHNFPWYKRNTCYMTYELEQQRVLLHDGSELRTDFIGGHEVVHRSIDETFRGVHYFNFINFTLTKGAHDFWSGVDQNSNRAGSIFDQPPGKLLTNLRSADNTVENVLGYFEVTAVDTARLKITNREIDRFYSDPCPTPLDVSFAPFMCFPCIERYFAPECLNCLVLRNSSYYRPAYMD